MESETKSDRTAYILSKKQEKTLICEWGTCENVYTDMVLYMDHLQSHIKELFPENTVFSNVQDIPLEVECQWRGCSYEVTTGVHELFRHIYFHGFHIHLKSIGISVIIGKKLKNCQLDSASRNMIPELPERFYCGWKFCMTITDNAWYFYQHVKEHAEDYPKGHGDKKCKCMWEGCETVVKTRYKIIDHLRSHTQEKFVACPTCGSLFSSNTKFIDHLHKQENTDEQNFQCSHCSKKFISERLLRDHMRRHVNNYLCPFCEMTTPSPSALRMHIKFRHSDVRDFNCPHCSSGFKTQRDMTRHIETQHGENYQYKCIHPDCNYQSKYEFDMKSHLRNKHNTDSKNNQLLYICDTCKSSYSRGSSLTKHMMSKHNFRWPPGHRKFRYKLGSDGMYHLQTVRYESFELTQQLQVYRQRKALLESKGKEATDSQKEVNSNHVDRNLLSETQKSGHLNPRQDNASISKSLPSVSKSINRENSLNTELPEKENTPEMVNNTEVTVSESADCSSLPNKRKRIEDQENSDNNLAKKRRKKELNEKPTPEKSQEQNVDKGCSTTDSPANQIEKECENVSIPLEVSQIGVEYEMPTSMQFLSEEGNVLFVEDFEDIENHDTSKDSKEMVINLKEAQLNAHNTERVEASRKVLYSEPRDETAASTSTQLQEQVHHTEETENENSTSMNSKVGEDVCNIQNVAVEAGTCTMMLPDSQHTQQESTYAVMPPDSQRTQQESNVEEMNAEENDEICNYYTVIEEDTEEVVGLLSSKNGEYIPLAKGEYEYLMSLQEQAANDTNEVITGNDSTYDAANVININSQEEHQEKHLQEEHQEKHLQEEHQEKQVVNDSRKDPGTTEFEEKNSCTGEKQTSENQGLKKSKRTRKVAKKKLHRIPQVENKK